MYNTDGYGLQCGMDGEVNGWDGVGIRDYTNGDGMEWDNICETWWQMGSKFISMSIFIRGEMLMVN